MGSVSTMAMSILLRRLDVAVTVHGFRSSFLDWVTEQGVAFEVAEHCLALATGRLCDSCLSRRRQNTWAINLVRLY
jgi:hypothetical protein